MTLQTGKATTTDFTLAKCIAASLIENDDFLWRVEDGTLVATFIDGGHLLARIAIPAADAPADAEWGLNVGRSCDTVASLPATGDIAVSQLDSALETLRFVSGHAAAKMKCVDVRQIDRPKVPPLPDATCIVEGIDSAWLAATVKSCAKHSDRIDFIATAGQFLAQSSEYRQELSGIALRAENATTNTEATATYDAGFLTDICKAVEGPLSIRFATNYPIIIETPRTLHMLGPIFEPE